jgi:proteasome lid subunit RPN8/RPN11
MTLRLPPPEIRIRRHALDKLRLYVERCPVEIGGLGSVVEEAEGLLITDLFILPQKVSASDTELDPDALFEFLGRLMAEGGDVAGVRLWWHSHADMDLIWSETDCATIGSLPGDFWVALVANRRGELLCRLDSFVPHRQTWELPLVEAPDGGPRDLEALRCAIDREILEQVRAYELIHEVQGNEGMAEVVTEYPILLQLEPPLSRPEPGEAGRRK